MRFQLRINVTSLLNRYEQILEQLEFKGHYATASLEFPIDASEKDELLKSVHRWMEGERIKAFVGGKAYANIYV